MLGRRGGQCVVGSVMADIRAGENATGIEIGAYSDFLSIVQQKRDLRDDCGYFIEPSI